MSGERLPCPACGAPADFQCEYMGRDQLVCTSFWCRDHIAVHGGALFCRRHVQIQAALREGVRPPALNNGAPALVLWMAGDVGESMVSSPVFTPTIRSLPLREVAISPGFFAWEAGWEIGRHHHHDLVTILVADEAPSLVNLRINDRIIPIGVPAWIEQHNQGKPDGWVTELRDVLRERLLSTIMMAVGIVDARVTA